jgi:hypothetical protein
VISNELGPQSVVDDLRFLANEIEANRITDVRTIICVLSTDHDYSVRTLGNPPRKSETIGLLTIAAMSVNEDQ